MIFFNPGKNWIFWEFFGAFYKEYFFNFMGKFDKFQLGRKLLTSNVGNNFILKDRVSSFKD